MVRVRAARAALLLALLPGTLGARNASETPLPEERVMSLYATALAGVLRPPAVTFTFAVEQLGLRNMEQVHRVYRSGLSERDETLAVDGLRLKVPAVRIIAGRVDRYDIERVAPKPNNYAFEYRGAVNESDGYGYVFVATSKVTSSFDVTEVEIDGRSFLPRLIRFKLGGANAHGSGELQYGAAERYWVVQSAGLSAHLADGSIAHESIHWSDYHFPAALPKSIFTVPRPAPTIPVLAPPGVPTPAPPGDEAPPANGEAPATVP